MSVLFLGGVLVFGCSSETPRGWVQEDGYRWRSVEPDGFFDQVGFEFLDSSRTGIEFGNTLKRTSVVRNRNYTNGSGVAVGDVNGDEWVDLYFGQLDGPNQLYLNDGTDGFSFRDATARAGLAHADAYTTGVTFADVDGDGDLDVLVASMGQGVDLYRNDGSGTFTRVSDSGLDGADGSTTLALADIDGDGDLDLYVTNYKETSAKDLFAPRERTFKKTVRPTPGDTSEPYALRSPFDEHYDIIYPRERGPDRRELGAKDQLYLNDGDGTFTEVANLADHFRSHTGEPKGLGKDWGLTARFQDMSGNGRPDLYVCNDFWTPDRLWLNQGNGIFREASPQVIRNFSFSSMAVDFSDVNADGETDFFVTEMLSEKYERRARQQVSFDPHDPAPGNLTFQPQYMRNSLYLGRDDSTFVEITYYSGTAATGWSWATRFLDVDLDGYEDLLVNTGHAHDVLDLDTQEAITRAIRTNTELDQPPILKYPPLPLPNRALKNDRDRTFSEKSAAWGFTRRDISHGLATGDLDRDGDLDLVMSRLNDPAAVYRNTANEARIGVRLRGSSQNTRGIGATLRLTGGPVPQSREMEAGGDYLSSSEPYVVFAATEGVRHQLTVAWPSGETTSLDSLKANRIYDVRAPESASRSTVSERRRADSMDGPIFKDISERLAHTHSEPYYNDFGVQQLIPLRLSQLGPGVSWLYATGDTGGDLYVASGTRGRMGIFENDGAGRFTKQTNDPLTEPALGDQTTLLGWTAKDGAHLVVGVSNYEQEQAQAPSAYHYRLRDDDTTLVQRFQGIRSSTGPLAAADYTGNGRLDLFIGGRFKPAKYPEDARSRLYTNREGTFQLDRANSALLREIGLVTGAVFVDYDNDGDQDLLCSRAWDSLVLLENQDGRLHDVSQKVGLSDDTGWWNGVATGDFNNDGRTDLVATNWGQNSRYQIRTGRPLKLFYDDFDGDRRPEVIEAQFDKASGGYVPYKPLYSFYETIPSVRRRVSSHREFSTASVAELTGRSPQQIPAKEITTLQHTLFLNTGGQYVARALPPRAQFAPAFSVGVSDYNNDGNDDLFLSQNLFALPKLTPRQDAGRGLLLRGDGTGQFESIDGSRSGIRVHGEQRGAALGDFNRDARVDLVVSQNGTTTKLYRNNTRDRGLRVVLRGPPWNQEAFGASLRIVYTDGTKGPLRHVQAGSGYWSQDSAVQVLGRKNRPDEVEVRWPDGTKTRTSVPPNQYEVVIGYVESTE